MKIRLFQYPVPAPDELPELNAYLASHRVASVSHYLAPAAGGGTMLVFVVETAAAGSHAGGASGSSQEREPKVDYRKVLNPEDFAVFSDLREERKRASQEQGIPVYSVFNNDHLAAMVTQRVRTLEDLKRVPGVAEGKAAKYGERMLRILREAFPATDGQAAPAEPNGEETG